MRELTVEEMKLVAGGGRGGRGGSGGRGRGGGNGHGRDKKGDRPTKRDADWSHNKPGVPGSDSPRWGGGRSGR